MRNYLFLTFFLSFSTSASDSIYQCGEKYNLASELQSFVGKECPSDDERILKRVETEYLEYYGKSPKVKKPVKGFNLIASVAEIKIANAMLGAKPPKGWKEAARGCQSVQCAFEKLFNSKEAAMQVFNIKAKSGYSLSLDQTINQNMKDQIWSAAEIREMDAMASKLPKELRHLSHLTKIDRMADGLRRSDDSQSVAAFASPQVLNVIKAELVAYDTGVAGVTTGKSPYETISWPQQAITHELCHHHDFKGYYATNYGKIGSEQKNSVFKKLSGWKEVVGKKGESQWVASKDAKFVSAYAQTAPVEDYAESCMNYLLNPELLKQKAPKKYAYMKKHVFNNKEFSGEVWATDKVKTWPLLNQLLADESLCNAKIAECSKDLKYRTWSSIESQVQNTDCFKNFQADHLQEINTKLINEESYCSSGGQNFINLQKNKICENSVKIFSNTIDSSLKKDFNLPARKCEEQNDFTIACVLADTKRDLKIPEELLPLSNKILSENVPERMKVLGLRMASMKSSVWLKPCLSGTKGIRQLDIRETDGTIRKSFYYYSGSKDFKDSFLGRYIWSNYDQKDVNLSCSQAMLSALEASGVKIPESGYPANIMQKPFKDELQSFEQEVLNEISTATKGCILSSCKEEKILELLKNWELKATSKRSGVATKEFAEELSSKVIK